MDSNKNLKVDLPIIRSGYEETKSARFKGILSFVSNEHGVIYDWHIKFTNLSIDKYSTPAWFNKNTSVFKYRDNLFKSLGLVQSPRPSRQDNDVVPLGEEQIKVVNDFFNDRSRYQSSIKNIVAVLKGNNPGGEAANPKSAELIIDNPSLHPNFVILLDDIVIKKTKTEKMNNMYEMHSVNAKKISFEEFVKKNPALEVAYNFLAKPKSKSEFTVYLKNIKEFYKTYNNYVDKAESLVRNARSQYSKNVDDSKQRLPFGFTNKREFQKAHIVDVFRIKQLVVEALREQKSYKNLLKLVSDPENFIPLPEHIHRQFDANNITFKTNGEMYGINEVGYNFMNQSVDEKFKYLPEYFLTAKRVSFLATRNQNVEW